VCKACVCKMRVWTYLDGQNVPVAFSVHPPGRTKKCGNGQPELGLLIFIFFVILFLFFGVVGKQAWRGAKTKVDASQRRKKRVEKRSGTSCQRAPLGFWIRFRGGRGFFETLVSLAREGKKACAHSRCLRRTRGSLAREQH
jgi:hypothetical protein